MFRGPRQESERVPSSRERVPFCQQHGCPAPWPSPPPGTMEPWDCAEPGPQDGPTCLCRSFLLLDEWLPVGRSVHLGNKTSSQKPDGEHGRGDEGRDWVFLADISIKLFLLILPCEIPSPPHPWGRAGRALPGHPPSLSFLWAGPQEPRWATFAFVHSTGCVTDGEPPLGPRQVRLPRGWGGGGWNCPPLVPAAQGEGPTGAPPALVTHGSLSPTPISEEECGLISKFREVTKQPSVGPSD